MRHFNPTGLAAPVAGAVVEEGVALVVVDSVGVRVVVGVPVEAGNGLAVSFLRTR